MDILLGLQAKDAVLLVTSKALSRGISVMSTNDCKVASVNKHSALAFSGEPGDTINFVEFIKANVQLYSFRHGIEMSPHAVAAFTRTELAKSIRSRKPFQVNVLIGGYDPHTSQTSLNWVDYLGTNVALPYAAHGYAQYYVLSTLDRHWRPEMPLDEAVELANRCISEVQARMPIDFKGVEIHVISKDGLNRYVSPQAESQENLAQASATETSVST